MYHLHMNITFVHLHYGTIKGPCYVKKMTSD